MFKVIYFKNCWAMENTVGPWELRFLGNEKTRAAQNRALEGQYYVIQCSKF